MQPNAHIYSYSRSRGFIAGLSLDVALIHDENAQAGFTLETGSDGTTRGEVFDPGDIYTALGEDGFQGLGFSQSRYGAT